MRDHRSHWVFAAAGDLEAPDLGHRLAPAARASALFRATAPVRREVRAGEALWYAGPPAGTRHPLHVAPPRAGEVARLRVDGGPARLERVPAPERHPVLRPRPQRAPLAVRPLPRGWPGPVVLPRHGRRRR